VRGTALPSPSLGFSLAKRARRSGGSESGPFGQSDFRGGRWIWDWVANCNTG
jgi:hypothetical protein